MKSETGDGRRNKRGSAVVTPPPRRARPAEEEELETGEPIPGEGDPAPAGKKIPARRVTADGRPAASPPPTPAGQIVLSSAKYLPASAFEEPESPKGKKKGSAAEPENSATSLEGRLLGGGVWGGRGLVVRRRSDERLHLLLPADPLRDRAGRVLEGLERPGVTAVTPAARPPRCSPGCRGWRLHSERGTRSCR
jgi:hypothetical protein